MWARRFTVLFDHLQGVPAQHCGWIAHIHQSYGLAADCRSSRPQCPCTSRASDSPAQHAAAEKSLASLLATGPIDSADQWAALVAGGVKAVVRFAYSSVRGALPTEPEPAAVLAHIQALAPVFNAPGVVTVQVDQRKVGCTSAQI